MKFLLLLAGCLALAGTGHAQISPLFHVINAATLVHRKLNPVDSPGEQPEMLYVTPAAHQGRTFPQKRTPARELPRPNKGGTVIRDIEQYLAGRYAAFQADTTALLLNPDQEKEFSRLRTYLEAAYPLWNTTPYTDEIDFYRQHDNLRRRLAPVPAQ